MKLTLSLLAAAAAGSATAFAPCQQGRASSAIAAKPFSDEIGSMAPLGLFDPLKLIEDGNQSKFDALRLYEITHGRVSMLAVVGYLSTAAGMRFPGAQDVPAGLKSFEYLLASKDGQNILLQMLAFFAVASIINRDAEWLDNKAEHVGDFRNGSFDLGWDQFDDETKLKKRTIELNNGRAAMMGIWGLVVHEMMGVSILPGGWLP
mmetsp:Transcript_38281/g.43146  ORF Transcript_38281/g.43146 Transcript_38281/m.43146 type:complete len:205 (-) Transcript_38281:156-770(-)